MGRDLDGNLHRTAAILLVIGLLASGMMLLASTDESEAFGEDWLSGYDYRKFNFLTDCTGIVGSYQIQVKTVYGSGTDTIDDNGSFQVGVVHLDSHARTDFADVEFTKADGTTPLDYWMENKSDSVSARFWVELDFSSSVNMLGFYVYYGNSSDSSDGSDGSAVFPFFDDFTSYNDAKWDQYILAGGATFTATGGRMKIVTTADGNNKYVGLLGDSTAGNNVLLTTKFRTVFSTVSTIPFSLQFDLQSRAKINPAQGYAAELGSTGSLYPRINEWTGTAWNQFADGTFTTQSNMEYVETIKNYGSTKAFYLDDYADNTQVVSISGTDTSHSSGSYLIAVYTPASVTATLYLDYFFIRTDYNIVPTLNTWSGGGEGYVTSEPDPVAFVGSLYEYQVETSVEETDYELFIAPDFLALDGSGCLSGVPSIDDVGEHKIVINISTPSSFLQDIFYLEVDGIMNNQPLYAVTNVTYNYFISSFSGDAYNYTLSGDCTSFLSESDGLISGIPTMPGTYNISIKMDDHPVWQNYSLRVYERSTIYSITNGDNCVLYPATNYGTAIYADEKLFITYFGENVLRIWVACYDYNLGEWLDPVLVDANPSSDSHCLPHIVIDDNGYIHLFAGAHNTNNIRYYRSDQPYNISAWTQISSSFWGTSGTYPVPFKNPLNGDLYVFQRTVGATDNQYWAFRKSTDNGTTWSDRVYLLNSGTSDNNCYYLTDLYLDVANGHVEVYLSLNLNTGYYPNSLRDEFAVVKWNLTDDHVYSMAGTDLGVQMDLSEFSANIVPQTDTGNFSMYAALTVKDGIPYLLYEDTDHSELWTGTNPSNGTFYLTRYVNGNWTDSIILPEAFRNNEYGYSVLVDHGENLKFFTAEYIKHNATSYSTAIVEYSIDWDLTNLSRSGVIASPYLSYLNSTAYSWQYMSIIVNDPYHGMVMATHGATDGSSYGNQTVMVYNDFGFQNTNQVGWLTNPHYAITSTPTLSGTEGTFYSYQAICNGSVNQWEISGNSTLSITTGGLVYGTISTQGTYTVNISAVTNFNTAYQEYTLNIIPMSVEWYVFTTTADPTVYEGLPYSYQGVINGTATGWGMSGNATFLTINTTTGLVSGTPGNGTVGSYNVDLWANTSSSTAYYNYTLTVLDLVWDSVTITANINGLSVTLSYHVDSGPPAEAITATYWEFGDGETSNSTAVLCTYASAGTYTVNVTVTNVLGENVTGTKNVTVTKASSTSPPRVLPPGGSGGTGGGSDAGGGSSGSGRLFVILIPVVLILLALLLMMGRSNQGRRRT